MIRLLFLLILVAVIATALYLIIRPFLQNPGSVRCSRCDGRGFWYGARGRETCDWCKGSGRLPGKV